MKDPALYEMGFGKYQGMTLGQIAAIKDGKGLKYLDWLVDQKWWRGTEACAAVKEFLALPHIARELDQLTEGDDS